MQAMAQSGDVERMLPTNPPWARTVPRTALLAVALIAAGCSGSDDPAESSATEATATEVEAAAATQVETTVAVEPSFTAGERTFGEVVIDGTVVEYITLVPSGFVAGDTAPVLLALPPGGQDASLATSIVRDVYQTEALARGWVVVSPAAPDGELYFQGSERLIPGFLDFITSWVVPEGGGVHLAGISNGGISSFRVATENPDRFRSVTVFPGFPTSDADRDALDRLTAIPVHLFVGERDTSWVAPMSEAADRLDELGGDVTYEVFPDEGHIISALSDGVRIFDELDDAR